MPHSLPFITEAPRDVSGWAALFQAQALPVLAATARTLDELRADEDAVDAHRLADAVADDPLLTLRLLAHVSALRAGREGGEVETVIEALVMLGIPPFFRAFERPVTVEDLLAEHPVALAGLNDVLRRSYRAARFAIAFAAHRLDYDAAVIREAALLHDFAELLLWLRAPALATEIRRRQQLDPGLRSVDVQQQVLNITLPDLQHLLMLRWRLPSLLVRITDHHQTADPQVRNVLLAIRVARHSTHGWDNAALPDDVRDIAGLLNIGAEPALRLLHDIDRDAP